MEKRNLLRKYFLQLLGLYLLVLEWQVFLLPNKLSSGGFTGIATIFYYFLKFDVGKTVIILNIPFFIWAFMKLGKKVFCKVFGRNFFFFQSLLIFLKRFQLLQTICC